MNAPKRARHCTPLILLLTALLALPAAAQLSTFATPGAELLRIQLVTVGTDDLAAFRAQYESWFNYRTAATGQVAAELAASWGTPETAGRDYALMHSEGTDDVWLRVVDVDVPQAQAQAAMTTYGWSVIEFLVEDADAVYEHLLPSPFRHIGGPANLGGGTSSIRATQFVGPGSVAAYLTADTAPVEEAKLPRAQSFIDRPFIAVLATPDPEGTDAFYRETFSLGGYPPRPAVVGVINDALGLDASHATPLGLATGVEAVNAIEIDGYPSGLAERARAPGQLPPGFAMVSFAVRSLDGLPVEFVEAPAKLYDGRRAATFVGPAGELTELIEVGGGGVW